MSTVPPTPENTTPVIVTTEARGVFFGYIHNDIIQKMRDAQMGIVPAGSQLLDLVFMQRARNLYFWDTENGILEAAEKGVKKGSKVGSRADIFLTKVCMVSPCTEQARVANEQAVWAK